MEFESPLFGLEDIIEEEEFEELSVSPELNTEVYPPFYHDSLDMDDYTQGNGQFEQHEQLRQKLENLTQLQMKFRIKLLETIIMRHGLRVEDELRKEQYPTESSTKFNIEESLDTQYLRLDLEDELSKEQYTIKSSSEFNFGESQSFPMPPFLGIEQFAGSGPWHFEDVPDNHDGQQHQSLLSDTVELKAVDLKIYEQTWECENSPHKGLPSPSELFAVELDRMFEPLWIEGQEHETSSKAPDQ